VLEGCDTAAVHPTARGNRDHRVVDPDARPEGGESLRDFYQRVASFAAGLAGGAPGPDHDIAVVAHGGTLRMLHAYLAGVPVEEMAWEPLGNGTILRAPVPEPVRAPD
jgi:broad specificity phosphatase PhoE